MNEEKAEFIIYIINEIANKKNIYPSEVYRVLDKTGCIKKYLTDMYDILHTMSSEKIVDDTLNYVGIRGEKL